MTKKKTVFNHLLTGASITNRDSVAMCELYSLSQTLGELRRNKGIPILSELQTTPKGERYSRYWLDKSYIEKVRKGEIIPKI